MGGLDLVIALGPLLVTVEQFRPREWTSPIARGGKPWNFLPNKTNVELMFR